MWKHEREAIDAVETFNQKVEETIGDHCDFSADHCMTMETNGNSTIVRYMGVVLWSNEDDERENENDPLLEFLEKKAIEMLGLFSKVLIPDEDE
jgi:hypothetical protein